MLELQTQGGHPGGRSSGHRLMSMGLIRGPRILRLDIHRTGSSLRRVVSRWLNLIEIISVPPPVPSSDTDSALDFVACSGCEKVKKNR